jgi:hypothetical protein
MGVYWITYLYYNVYDTTKYVVLNQTEQIIRPQDIQNGFFKLEDLNQQLINPADINENSYVVEFLAKSYNGVEKIETNRLKIRYIC